MKKSIVLDLKIYLFRLVRPLEQTFAYNRKRRDKWIMDRANRIPNGSKVLDVGAGGCPYKSLFNHCEYYAHDFVQLSSSQIQDEKGYGKIDFVSDILDIPVDDSSFDVILCTEVIEHVPDPISVIREVSRILKPGGILLITAPLQSGLHQEPYHFYGGFTKYWYEKFLEEFNFSDIRIEANGSLHTTYFALGLTIYKKWLEILFEKSNFLRRILAFVFLLIFLPFYLVLNPLFCFAWERIYNVQEFTAGYHVSARKK